METPSMTDFLTLAERQWRGELDLVHADHPVGAGYPGAQEIAPGLLYFKGVAAISVVDTGAGLVMFDAGTKRDIDRVHEAVRDWRPDTPLVAAIYSHHHMDHLWATRRFDEEAAARGWPRPVVHAHALLPAHLDRYRKTQSWNRAINRRQFLVHADRLEWPVDYRYPDVTFERATTLRIGEMTIELRHARGETDDHVWAWIPERRWLFPGDLFIWAVPNAGNPQKVQRYCAEWGQALREMAALDIDLFVCGHGLPIVGSERTRQALLDTAEYVESIESQTVALMNRALPLDEILQRVVPPPHLADRPYLQPIYDHPQFLVRNVWRRYGGWWDGEPDNLLPAPRRQQAREWVALAGGVAAVLARVEQLEAEGDLRMAGHLVEMAMLSTLDATDGVSPGTPSPTTSNGETADSTLDESHAAFEARARVYAARSAAQRSTMGRGIFNHFAVSSRERRRDRLADLADAPEAKTEIDE
jgi:glyoxylase-like metal-dependent hydrolase (beta-lactamase superfamily II)